VPFVFGLVFGLFIFACFWAVAGPFLAIFNFICGRFFIASVLACIGLFCEDFLYTWGNTQKLENFQFQANIYTTILILGLAMEGLKLYLKFLWWLLYKPRPITIQVEEEGEEEPEWPPMKDITPRARLIR
jgi:hypothetical protein